VRYGYGQHTHGWGGGGILLLIVLVLFAIIIIGGVWLVMGRSRQPSADGTAVAVAGPEQILAERLARGEIEPDEYRTRLAALREQGPRT